MFLQLARVLWIDDYVESVQVSHKQVKYIRCGPWKRNYEPITLLIPLWSFNQLHLTGFNHKSSRPQPCALNPCLNPLILYCLWNRVVLLIITNVCISFLKFRYTKNMWRKRTSTRILYSCHTLTHTSVLTINSTKHKHVHNHSFLLVKTGLIS